MRDDANNLGLMDLCENSIGVNLARQPTSVHFSLLSNAHMRYQSTSEHSKT